MYNPVDWYPWGDEALQRARREDKPIFLSIGYAACHWCHVMERESFEDPDTAALLNRDFVSIKVDREERPDIDEIYMNAVQLMTGSGGWPLSVFLTPGLRPFVGGTYFPPRPGLGRISFPELLSKVAEAWRERREEIDSSAGLMAQHLRRIARGEEDPAARGAIGREEMEQARRELEARFDASRGGFGPAPKFPPDGALAILLRHHARTADPSALRMAERTLEAMALGGIYDQVGGGFCRYSVDEIWLVPHFEKMLYNQALLVPLYLDAWRLTGKPLYRRVAEESLDFVRRELTAGEGGFWSSLDADSEGEEGRFYVWTPEQVRSVLGDEEGDRFCELYGITAQGNFEGRSIPNLLGTGHDDGDDPASRTASLRARLLEARERRARPATDDKVLTAWNGLMISAFARAAQLLGRDSDLDSARRAARFVMDRLMRDDRLLATHREGQSRLNAYLDDYAFFVRALIDLYETCFEPGLLRAADRLAASLVARFEDRERGGFFFTSDDHEELLARNRSGQDGALPSGAGVAAEALLRLGLHLDSSSCREAARRALESSRPAVRRLPSAFTTLLIAADLAAGPALEVAVIGDPADPATSALLDAVHRRCRPGLALAVARPGEPADDLPLLRGKTALEGKPTAYVCRDYACKEPTTRPDELERLLDEAETS